jgi:putative FmdB family regulatory protein
LPTYEYRCLSCEHQFERFQRMSDDPVKECEVCGASVKRLLFPVAIHFKGNGFYSTDYGQKGTHGSAGGSGTNGGDRSDSEKSSSSDSAAAADVAIPASSASPSGSSKSSESGTSAQVSAAGQND